MGAYGSRLGLTPTLDRFAREGVRFDVTRAHVPLTLPSHTTIMTALYPFANGVRDNGTFRFDGGHATLASTLKAAGYSTAAFVGSFILDARFGLNIGFDRYDDRMHGSGANLEVVQRSAEQVLEPAAQWILGAGDAGQPATSPQAPRGSRGCICTIRTSRTRRQSPTPRGTPQIRIQEKWRTRMRLWARLSNICGRRAPSIERWWY